MRRLIRTLPVPVLLFTVLLSPAAAAEERGDGYRLFDATAATVNGDVVFLSDVVREACLLRCGAFPPEGPAEVSLAEARERRIADVLVLQEQEKLELGSVDNTVLQDMASAAAAAMARCSAPCARQVTDGQVRDFLARRILVRDFLRKRVSVFIDVNEEEVQREIQRRISRLGVDPADLPEETVRRELIEEKSARETRNWFDRATSKSRILLSPLEEP